MSYHSRGLHLESKLVHDPIIISVEMRDILRASIVNRFDGGKSLTASVILCQGRIGRVMRRDMSNITSCSYKKSNFEPNSTSLATYC